MKKLILIILILTTILTTGCWDMVEINQRVFPYSVGFDLVDEEKDLFNITLSYPNISALGKNPVQEDRVYIITTTGKNIFEATHNLSSRLQYPISNKHLRVLIITEDIAKNKKYIKEILDGINRDYEVNKGMQLVIIKDKAKELLESIPNATKQEAVEGTLFSLLSNIQNSSNFTPKTIANFINDMDESGASIIPLIHPGKDEVEFSGGGVFKDYKFDGYIDHIENKAIAILNDDLKMDGFDIDYNGINLSILATGFKRKIRLIDSKDIKIKFEIKINAQIHEYTLADGIKIDNEEIIKGMEEELNKKIEKDLNTTILRTQKEFKADVFEVADYLRKYHNKLWLEVENDWNEIYSNADITAEVKVNIKRRGLTK